MMEEIIPLIPKLADQFTDHIQFYMYDTPNNPTYSYELSDDVFTWSEQGFSFYSSCPVDGQYALGLIDYDFDNTFFANFKFMNYTR